MEMNYFKYQKGQILLSKTYTVVSLVCIIIKIISQYLPLYINKYTFPFYYHI